MLNTFGEYNTTIANAARKLGDIFFEIRRNVVECRVKRKKNVSTFLPTTKFSNSLRFYDRILRPIQYDDVYSYFYSIIIVGRSNFRRSIPRFEWQSVGSLIEL